LPYGGIQEPVKNGKYSRLKSCEHQAWSATGYMSMIINGIAGFSPGKKQPEFNFTQTEEVKNIEIRGLHFNGRRMNMKL
jgi:hypothetical protein